MEAIKPKPVRRIVTGHDARGRSIVTSDAATPHVRTSPHRPGVAFSNIWTTDRTPAPVHGPADPVTPAMNLAPPTSGSNLRIVEFAPEKTYIGEITPERARAAFGAMGGAAQELSGARHPFMHRTKSVDYGIVLEGEIWLVLDDSEVQMRAGDICIQRGTNHAWSNRSDKPCRIAFVLIDGDRLEP